MNLIRLLIVGMTLFLILGCGGSGSSPEIRDLTGLEGEWKIVGDIHSSITLQDKEYSDSYSADWHHLTVTKNTVISDPPGDSWSWAYDGVTLILKDNHACNYVDYSHQLSLCGEIVINLRMVYTVKIEPGQSIALMNGTGDGVATSEFCGEGAYNRTFGGTITKV
jgi:hypothetical protein